MDIKNRPFQIVSLGLIMLMLVNLIPQAAYANPASEDILLPFENSTAATDSVERLGEIKEKRTRNTKFFMNSDMTTTAEIYSNSVHYHANGKWEDIDNTIIEDLTDTELPLRNKANDMVVKLARNFSGNNKLVSVKIDGYTISFSPVDGNKAKAEFGDNPSSVMYKNIYPEIDFEYVINSDMVKENIILNSYTGKNQFQFQIQSPQLTPKAIDNKVLFINELEEEIFSIPAPFMFDQAQEYSKDISISLDALGGNYYILTYSVDAEWLESPKRQYPILIDPLIQTKNSVWSSECSYIYSNTPDQNNGTSGYMWVGRYYRNSNEYRSLIKWPGLPVLQAGDAIINAKLYLHTFWDPTDWTNVPIHVHQILSPWQSDTVTWNNQPEFDTVVKDYARNINEFEITSLVKEWYQSETNYGLLLKTRDWELGKISAHTNNSSSTYWHPYLTITYSNLCGLEDYWAYSSHNLGRSGTADVNIYNGNMVYSHNDVQLSGNRLPLQIYHTYNSNFKEENIGFGKGWRLNLQQTVKKLTIETRTYYVYTDGDGTTHYFTYDPMLRKFVLEAGGQLLEFNKLADGTIIINDNQDSKLHFNLDGNLFKIEDRNCNLIYIGFSDGRVISIEDAVGRITNLSYDSNGYLNLITDPSGKELRYYYTEGNLTKIGYPDLVNTEFQYVNDMLVNVKHHSGQKFDIQYYIDGKVQNIFEIGNQGSVSQKHTFLYQINGTVVSDVNGQTTTYLFNRYGNAINIIDSDKNAASLDYRKNLVYNAIPFQNTTENLIKNHSMEQQRDWTLEHEDSVASGDYFYGGLFGKYSLQIIKTDQIGRSYFRQDLNITPGTYTFSANIKTSGISGGNGLGAALLIKYLDESGNWISHVSQGIIGNQDWQRMHMTFSIPCELSSYQIIVGLMVEGAQGTAWFDCAQLEKGIVPTNYNLLENPSFEVSSDSNDLFPAQWSGYSLDSNDVLTANDAIHGNKSFLLNGNEDVNKGLYQSINIIGKKEDVFVVSGWANARSIPRETYHSFLITVRFWSSDWPPTNIDIPVFFNKDYYGWQFVSGAIKAPFDYDGIAILLNYGNNCNQVFFDGIQLYKTPVTSFTYDNNYNLTSVQNANNHKTQLYYNLKNDLTNITPPSGANYSNYFDTKHNLLTTFSPNGTISSYSYNQYGNVALVSETQLNNANYVRNGHFSDTQYWWPKKVNDTGNISITNTHSIYGNSAMWLQSIHTGQAGYLSAYQDAKVHDEKVYTLGLWLKTNLSYSNATVVIEQYSSWYPIKTDYICTLSGSNDWTYRYYSFKTEPDVNKVNIYLKIERNQIDGLEVPIIEEAWFDGIQLEISESPSYYNHLHNSDFEFFTNSAPTGYQLISTDGITLDNNNILPIPGKRAIALTSSPYTPLCGYLDLNQVVNLKPDTPYTVSFWVKGEKLSNTPTIAEALCKDITGQDSTSLFTYSIQEESFDWRNVSLSFITPDNANTLSNLRLGFVSPSKGKLWVGNLSLKEQGTTNITYTSDGNYAHTVTDSAGQIAAVYDYNLLSGNLNSVTDINGNVQSYTYDTLGRVTSVTDQTSGVSQSYVYHETDNLFRISRSDFDYLFGYDAFGRRTTVSIDENGNQTALATNTYSNIGMLTSTTFGNGQIIDYSYDNNYQLNSVQHNGSCQYSYCYDARGNIAMVVDNVNAITTWYSYDLADRLVSQRDSEGRYVVYDYDKENNVTSVKETVNGETVTTSYTYNIDNSIDKVTTSSGDVYDFHRIDNILPLRTVLTTQSGNTIETQYTFNSKNQLTRLDNSLDNYYYEYDLLGNIAGISSNTYQAGYTYDSLNQLTSETLTRNGLTTTTGFSYDPHGNMINRTAGSKETLYTYHLDRLIQIEEKENGVTTGTQTLNYDDAGNLITDGEYTYTWQMGRQLGGVSGPNLTTTYKYNENGLRTEKTVNGKIHEYTLLGSSVTREVIRDETGNIVWTIHYSYAGDSSPVSLNVNGTEYYYLKNAQGDITHIVDGNGSEVASYEYDAWGNHLSITGGDIAQLNPYRYRGYRYDIDTGLYYLQSRYYNPEWGRYICADALTLLDDIGGANKYAYCVNDPNNLIDTNGAAYQPPPLIFYNGKWHKRVKGDTTYHNVVRDFMAKEIGGTTEFEIPGSGKKGGTGRADIIRGNEIWEVKPNTAGQRWSGRSAIKRYTRANKDLAAGGPVIFPRTEWLSDISGNKILITEDWPISKGLILYDVYTPMSEQEVKDFATATALFALSFFVFVISGGSCDLGVAPY